MLVVSNACEIISEESVLSLSFFESVPKNVSVLLSQTSTVNEIASSFGITP
jgi:hypothetical protein